MNFQSLIFVYLLFQPFSIFHNIAGMLFDTTCNFSILSFYFKLAIHLFSANRVYSSSHSTKFAIKLRLDKLSSLYPCQSFCNLFVFDLSVIHIFFHPELSSNVLIFLHNFGDPLLLSGDFFHLRFLLTYFVDFVEVSFVFLLQLDIQKGV